MPPRHASPFSLANLCCLAGFLLVLYAAFLLHSAVGCFVLGSALIVTGVNLHRKPGDSAAKRR